MKGHKGEVAKVETNDTVLHSIIRRLQARLKGSLKEVWLFGSRARGVHSSDSDYDILIVAEGNLNNIREIVSEEEYRLLQSNYYAMFSSITSRSYVKGRSLSKYKGFITSFHRVFVKTAYSQNILEKRCRTHSGNVRKATTMHR